MNREKAFGLLGVVPGDSLEMVKAKYRSKAKQCHPDRFAHDPSLMKAAEVEMTRINLAYNLVCTQLKSVESSSYGLDGDTAKGTDLIPWLFLLNWSLDIAKPLIKKARGFLSFQQGHQLRTGDPGKPIREECPGARVIKKSFDDILQQKVADMKNSQHHEKQ